MILLLHHQYASSRMSFELNRDAIEQPEGLCVSTVHIYIFFLPSKDLQCRLIMIVRLIISLPAVPTMQALGIPMALTQFALQGSYIWHAVHSGITGHGIASGILGVISSIIRCQ